MRDDTIRAMLNVLVTMPFGEARLDRLRAVSPELRVTAGEAATADYARADVLYAGDPPRDVGTGLLGDREAAHPAQIPLLEAPGLRGVRAIRPGLGQGPRGQLFFLTKTIKRLRGLAT